MANLLRYLTHYDHWIVTVMALTLTGLIWVVFESLGIKNPLNQDVTASAITDNYYRFATDETDDVNAEIIVVNIGQVDSRTQIAQCLTVIDSLQPRAIGVDVIFKDKRESSSEDIALQRAIAGMANKLVMAKIHDDGHHKAVHSFFIDSVPVREGFVDFIPGAVRNAFKPVVVHHNNVDTSFVGQLYQYWNGSVELEESIIPIDFQYRFTMILPEEVSEYAEFIHDGVVLVGDATAIGDRHRTPKGEMPGVLIHAYCLKTLHEMRHYPTHASWLVNLLLALLWSYLLELALSLVHVGLRRHKRIWSIFMKEWIEGSCLTNIVLLPFLSILTLWTMDAALNEWRYYNVAFIIASLVMVVESRNIYQALIRSLRMKHDHWILSNSLITG